VVASSTRSASGRLLVLGEELDDVHRPPDPQLDACHREHPASGVERVLVAIQLAGSAARPLAQPWRSAAM
jgi:hypothetical protein